MGLTPNGYELNYVCETLSYQYLSHGLGSDPESPEEVQGPL